MREDEYKTRIRNYLQSPQSTDEVWEYVLDSLMDVAATQGLDFLDEQILSEQELAERILGSSMNDPKNTCDHCGKLFADGEGRWDGGCGTNLSRWTCDGCKSNGHESSVMYTCKSCGKGQGVNARSGTKKG